jgi:hypothetical protein
MSEGKRDKSKRMRRAVIIRHRKEKNLCLQCGRDFHDGNCIEEYTKTDNRNIQIKDSKILDLRRKKDTILSYRKKKLLCPRCGKEQHNGACIENYEKSDNRTEEEKRDRPATIPTPKVQSFTILEEIKSAINKEVKIKLQMTQIIKLQRDFIVLCILPSKNGNIVEFSCLNHLSRRYPHYIIVIVGELEKNFPYSDLMKIRKLTNVKLISSNQQEIINYLCKCKCLFSFENDYTDYCQKELIKTHVFEDGKNANNFLKDSAFAV